MFNEIGSNFFEEKYINNEKNLLPKTNISYLDSGRSAIRLLLDNINLKEKRVLLPAYTCNTVLEPFIKRNYELDYYDVDDNLCIEEENFKNKVEYFKPKIILVHAYFGKDTLKSIREYLKIIKKHIYVIEDITQLLLKDNVDILTGSFVVGSIRKWCAIPDGGFIKNNTDISISTDTYSENESFIKKQLEAFEKKLEYVKTLKPEFKQEYLALFNEAIDELNHNEKIFLMSNYTKEALSIYNFKLIKMQRRKNYQYLLDNLEIDGINNALGKLDEEETPLYFPILVEPKIRKELQSYMAKENIYCPIIWNKPEILNIESYNAHSIYDKILCIPCDQRYNKQDMERIVTVIKKFYEKR